jgi:hypothetical protein
MPEVIGELAQKGKRLLLEDAYAIAEDIQRVSDLTQSFILDPAENPERFNPPDLPACVLIAQGGEFISPVRMQEIVDLYNGKNLPDDLSSSERNLRIYQQRRRLVLTRGCRHEGCTETVVVTVELAGRAIIGHKLIEIGAPYEPPSLCKRHRTQRDQAMDQDRSRKRRNRKKKGKGKALGTIGDVNPEARAQVQAGRDMMTEEDLAAARAPGGPSADDHAVLQRMQAQITPDDDINDIQPVKEETDGDCPVPVAAPVESQAEA